MYGYAYTIPGNRIPTWAGIIDPFPTLETMDFVNFFGVLGLTLTGDSHREAQKFRDASNSILRKSMHFYAFCCIEQVLPMCDM